MKMKLILGLTAFVCLFSACSNDDDNIGNWIEVNTFFSGIPRDGQVHFTIGDVAYVGLGVNTTTDEEDDDDTSGRGDFITEDGVFADLWKFDGGTWTQEASLVQATGADTDNRNVARRNAVAFAANGKGYVGTGQIYNRTDGWEEVSDFWSYDPVTGSWNKIADYPGGKRTNAWAFSIGDYGYVGCGMNSRTTNDFWRFDAKTETWDAQKYTAAGEKREGAQVFVINDFAYVISGRNNGVDLYDVYKFDPTKLGTENAWEEQTPLDDSDFDFENVRRSYGVAWSTNGRGYVATGTRNGSSLSDVWEFNPANQEWEEKQAFEGRPRRKAAAFVLDGIAYISGGATSNSNAYDDIWRFDPFAEYDSED